MKNFRAGRCGVEPAAAVIRERVQSILGDDQLEAIFTLFEGEVGKEDEAEHGGLTRESPAWQITM